MGCFIPAFRTLSLRLSCLLLFVFSATHAVASTEGYTLAPIPDWVKPVRAFDPDLVPTGEDSHGFHSRLHDFQYNGTVEGESEHFNASEYTLTNRYGVENYSDIEISFDPSYERLQLHELLVQRGDRQISKLDTARFDLLRTEQERSELIYDGTRTLAIVLDDIRPGDTVRYSYTISGENPIYQGHREFRIHTELWTATDRQYSRILTRSDNPFNRRVRGTDVPLVIKDENGVQEIVIDQLGVPEFSIEDDVPSWHYNRGTIVFSDMKDWRSVVDWVYPMYQLADNSNAEITTIASVIKSAHDDPRHQIGAALRWVQDEIRYFGVELGKNSHWPSRPEETLKRRFGDCKDKALLLVALLKELGVQAQPALVNTRRGLEAANYPYRMHAFNHVIVHVHFDGTDHFIDPTRSYQSGGLGELHEPDYGLALILAPETTGLVEMDNNRSRYSMSVTKDLRITPSEPVAASASNTGDPVSNQPTVSIDVETIKRGRLAESVRYKLDTEGLRAMGNSYLDYYQGYFSGALSRGLPVIDDSAGDRMQVKEQYTVNDFWLSDENVDRYRWLYADEIISFLESPDNVDDRQQPFELVHPIVIDETWQVTMPDNYRLDDLDAEFSNDWMSFSKQSTISEDNTGLTVVFRFRTLSNEVAAKDLKEFADSVDTITDLASFYIEDTPTLKAALSTTIGINEATRINWLALAACILVLLLVCVVLVWIDSRMKKSAHSY